MLALADTTPFPVFVAVWFSGHLLCHVAESNTRIIFNKKYWLILYTDIYLLCLMQRTHIENNN